MPQAGVYFTSNQMENSGPALSSLYQGGNIKSLALEDIYNKSNVFANLKDRNNLKGKCGNCENRYICGGCRGKAYGKSSDYLGEDPDCYIFK